MIEVIKVFAVITSSYYLKIIKFYLPLIITSCVPVMAFFQNSVWSIPPNYIEFPSFSITALPTQPSPTSGVPNYYGQFSEFMHNAIQDENGELRFFIIDGVIYDQNGYGIDQIQSVSMKGYSEIIICPVPGNCNQYYIVIPGIPGDGSRGGLNIEYAILDLSIQNVFTNRMGALISPNFGIPPGNQAIFGDPNTFPLSALAPNFKAIGESEWKSSMAITPLRSDETRFLFVMGEFDLFRYKVTSAGIIYDARPFTLSFPNAHPVIEHNYRAEMEVVETANGYRLAFAYPTSTGGAVHVSELDLAGNELGSHIFTIPRSTNLVIPKVRGLEFSPNKRYLYVTHDSNSNNPIPFSIFDTSSNTGVVITNNQFLNDVTDFKDSQIELGQDGFLYLVNNRRIASIGNADSPNSFNWDSSKASIQYHISTLNFPVTKLQLYPLPDQIDGGNYLGSFSTNEACCIQHSTFDVSANKGNEVQVGTQIWRPGNNPFNSMNGLVTIRNKLVIKNGAKIQANGMRFEFSPQAKLIIENGSSFSANDCTFTLNQYCSSQSLWQGIEVWGAPGFQPLVSGKFVVKNSLIEHAIEGIANSKHKKDVNGNPIHGAFEQTHNGGVIVLTQTKLRNNVTSILFEPYQGQLPQGLPMNDGSRFTDCEFVTDAPFLDPFFNTKAVIYAVLNLVHGIEFIGCDFRNLTSSNNPFSYSNRPIGIQASGTDFTVSALCNQTISPCPSSLQDPSLFENLSYAIYADGLPGGIVRISRSEFINNWNSITLKYLTSPDVFMNRFDVGRSIGSGNQLNLNGKGLYLESCNGYRVENNAFTTSYQGYLGIQVDNSGPDSNLIYKNTFRKFTVGSLVRSTNGDLGAGINSTGLEFKCNEYYDSIDYDILISNGSVKSFQGSCSDATGPANNRFSYTAQYGDIWLENNVPLNISYQFSSGGQNLAPRVGFFNISTPSINPTVCSNLPIFDSEQACPNLRITNSTHLQSVPLDPRGKGNKKELP